MAENNFAITSEVTGRGSLQEERATRQGQDRRTPEDGREQPVAASARQTEPPAGGMVGLLQLRNPPLRLPGLDRHVTERVRSFLARRHKEPGRGTRRFSWTAIHLEFGVNPLIQNPEPAAVGLP